jgi:transposase
MDRTGEQWNLIGTIPPTDPTRHDQRGRPWTDRRQVLNGVLWTLRPGAPWEDLPGRYGKHQTAHRRFQNWVRSAGLRDHSEQVFMRWHLLFH